MTLPVEVNPLLMGGGGYKISRSLRIRSSATAYLTRTLGTPTSNTVWTYSIWVKRGQLGTAQTLLSSGAQTLSFTTTGTVDALSLYSAGNPVATSASVYRDPSAWYHIVASSSGSVITVYVNNVSRLTYTGTLTNINSASAHYIGRYGNSAADYLDGYLAEVNFIDGQALTPSSFGENNATTGVWQPKAYTGTYGTNGFYLKFADNSAATAAAIGKDSSGNGNNWTPTNISVTAGVTYDSMIDTPTPYDDGGNGVGNYAVINPVDKGANVTIAAGNIDFTASASGTIGKGTIGVSSGKWYWEVTATSANNLLGICQSTEAPSATYVGSTSTSYGYSGGSGNKYNNNSGSAYGATYTTNDVIGVALDMDNGAVYFAKNNTWQNSGVPTSGSSKTGAAYTSLAATIVPAFGNNTSSTLSVNFGQRPFTYTPPSGFKALNTQNLPTPTIAAGNAYMDALLYTGNATARSITGLNFQPDFAWIKVRSIAGSNVFTDAVRGTDRQLFSNLTNAEQTSTGGITAFNSNGFSLGTGVSPTGSTNENTQTYVAWNWKANGSGSSNTSGTITSTVSANVTAGFSVVSYAGTAANATVGHGLGVAPDMIITKNRDGVTDWWVYHSALGNTKYLVLDTTAAAVTSASAWNNTSPSSTVFTLGAASPSNANRDIAYCFAAVSGYSAFGSYTGNGSTDGPFVFTGFRPRYVLIKRTDVANSWAIADTSRSPSNVVAQDLYAEASLAEGTSTSIDILSNGFKLRTTAGYPNASGGTYIYAAFAENPFKYSLAR